MRRGDPQRPAVGRPLIQPAPAVVLCGLLALLLWSTAACRGPSSAGGPAADAGEGIVTHVVDGDTVDVRIGGRTERVRLIGVDTPEVVAPTRPVQCYGAEASAHTKQLLPAGTAVRLERDAVSRDQYGRLLAYVYRSGDNLLVNLDLVAGWLRRRRSPTATTKRCTGSSPQPRPRHGADGVGLWATCGGPDVDIGPPPR